jgi:enoyl-CoA hydratase
LDGFETLLYEKQDRVAYVTLNRPHALNVYTVQMRDDLFEVLGAIKDDPDVRVVIFKGAGDKAFCAGADLSQFLTAPSPTIARKVRFGRDVWARFLSIPQPLIAAVHGYVLGSGMEIALCCDIRIASEDVQFGLPEVGLGIIPAAGGTQTLPRVIGRTKAMEMLLTNHWVKAQEAFDIGLVNRLVTREQLIPFAQEMARKIALCDPAAIRLAKQAVIKGLDMSLVAGLDLERRLAMTLKAHGVSEPLEAGS